MDENGSKRQDLISSFIAMSLSIPRVRFNVSECSGRRLTYVPAKDPSKALLQIDDNDVEVPVVHDVTYTKRASKGETPRHIVTPTMARALCSPVIVPAGAEPSTIERLQCPPSQVVKSASDVVEASFPDSNSKATVLFGSANSQHATLRHVHNLYKTYQTTLETLLGKVPGTYLRADDLAGGSYLPCGFGCMAPGPVGCPPNWRGHQIPYLRATERSSAVREINEIYGELLGAVNHAIAELCPDIKKESRKLCVGADDLIYPSPELQQKGKEVHQRRSARKRKRKKVKVDAADFWPVNQWAVRVMGKKFKASHTLAQARIALHTDNNDHPCPQPLMFFPMGGLNGRGGHVKNTDLLVFENKTGGLSVRVPTTVEDTVVICLFDGALQLHASAVEEETDQDCSSSERLSSSSPPPCWSMRFIPYIRGPIMEFIKARLRYGAVEAFEACPFVDLPPKVKKKPARSLRRKDIRHKTRVAAIYDNHWFHAIVEKETDGKITLRWCVTRQHTPNSRAAMYSAGCLDTDKIGRDVY